MTYKKMRVWSGGSENAKTTKINAIGYGICFILLCSVHIISFTANMNDNKTTPVTLRTHIMTGMLFIGLLGWLTVLMFFAAKTSFKDIKTNKLISLYLYRIEDFARIGEIPEDKFILFSDNIGVVLADEKDRYESMIFCSGAKYFYEFEKYFDKNAVEKMEICQ